MTMCYSCALSKLQKHSCRLFRTTLRSPLRSSKEIAIQLKALELIPEAVECDIRQSRSKEEANAHLLNHLKEDADEETVREVFKIASEKAGYVKMKVFAAGVLRELQ